jgi:Ca-activated chloride channel homolog
MQMFSNLFSQIAFEQVNGFWLFSIPICLLLLYIFFNKLPNQYIASINLLPNQKPLKKSFKHVPIILRLASICTLILFFCKPYKKNKTNYKTKEGINIVLCMDVSGSMLARDFTPNRLEACKEMANDLLDRRPYDNVGIVMFSGEPFTASILTANNAQLKNTITQLDANLLSAGTVIGEGLAMSIAQCTKAEGNSIIILLTDGKEEGSNKISAINAAKIASNQNIKIYCIGIGSNNLAPVPVLDGAGNVHLQPQKVELDEATLQKIASITGGIYYRAADNNNLATILSNIDKIEKTSATLIEQNTNNYLYKQLLIALAFFIIAEILFSKFYLYT